MSDDIYVHPEHDGADPDAVKKVKELVTGIRTCMLATLDDDGGVVSRPMTTLDVDYDGDAWFFVSASSDTVAQVKKDARVNLAYAGDSGWVSLSGHADTVDDLDHKKKLWNPYVDAWFTNGPEDPDCLLLRVHGDSAQYWDAPAKPGQLIALVKAKITGNQPEMGESHSTEL